MKNEKTHRLQLALICPLRLTTCRAGSAFKRSGDAMLLFPWPLTSVWLP